jgi:hypothetical protein
MTISDREALAIHRWRVRLKQLYSDLLDAISCCDADLIADCLVHLADAIDDHPPLPPTALEGILSATAGLVASNAPRVIAESLALIASITAVSTPAFMALVMADAALVRAVADHCLACESSAAVIIANLCSENRENVDRIFTFIDPRRIGELLIDREVKVHAKCGFAAIFAAVCSFPLSREEGNLILGFVRNCLELHSNENDLTDELFLSIARLRKHTENAIELCWENGLLNCINLLRTELSAPSVITILECYGEALQDELMVAPLDFHKLSDFICHPNQSVADTAMWLMWNCVERQDHAELIHPDFLGFLFRMGRSGSLSMLKHSLLIWSRLIAEASIAQINVLATHDFTESGCELLADEVDDAELVTGLTKAIVKLLSMGGEIECFTRAQFTTALISQCIPTEAASVLEELKNAICG